MVPAARCYRAALTRLIRDGIREEADEAADRELTVEEEVGFIMLADALQGMRRL